MRKWLKTVGKMEWKVSVLSGGKQKKQKKNKDSLGVFAEVDGNVEPLLRDGGGLRLGT